MRCGFDADGLPDVGDDLPRANLGGFAQFELTIDLHFSCGNECLRLSPTLGNAGRLQQIAEGDEFTAKFKLDVFHSDGSDCMRSMAKAISTPLPPRHILCAAESKV